MAYAEGQCVFFAKVISMGIDDSQPVGIRILAETDVNFGVGNCLADTGQVGGRRFRGMLKIPVWFFAEQVHLATERLQ